MEPLASIDAAVAQLRRGGLLVYPTEAVWGLGCDPFQPHAVQRLLDLKQRPVGKGVILIAAGIDQLEPLLDLDALPAARRAAVLDSWPGPFTWSLPCAASVPAMLRGDHATLAARVSAHPTVRALCLGFGGAIVSTSANLGGQPPVRQRAQLDPDLLAGVDAILDGETGGLLAPTPIRDALSGELLRA